MGYWEYDNEYLKSVWKRKNSLKEKVIEKDNLIDDAKEKIKEAEETLKKFAGWDAELDAELKVRPDNQLSRVTRIANNERKKIIDEHDSVWDDYEHKMQQLDKLDSLVNKKYNFHPEKKVLKSDDKGKAVWADTYDPYGASWDVEYDFWRRNLDNLYPIGNLSGLDYHPDTLKSKEEKERVSPDCYKTETYSIKVTDKDWKDVVGYLEKERDNYKKQMLEQAKKHSDLHMSYLDEKAKFKKIEEENKRLRKIVDLIENNPEEYKRRKELDPYNEEKWEED